MSVNIPYMDGMGYKRRFYINISPINNGFIYGYLGGL